MQNKSIVLSAVVKTDSHVELVISDAFVDYSQNSPGVAHSQIFIQVIRESSLVFRQKIIRVSSTFVRYH